MFIQLSTTKVKNYKLFFTEGNKYGTSYPFKENLFNSAELCLNHNHSSYILAGHIDKLK